MLSVSLMLSQAGIVEEMHDLVRQFLEEEDNREKLLGEAEKVAQELDTAE